jgi:hypothetical protein
MPLCIAKGFLSFDDDDEDEDDILINDNIID